MVVCVRRLRVAVGEMAVPVEPLVQYGTEEVDGAYSRAHGPFAGAVLHRPTRTQIGFILQFLLSP